MMKSFVFTALALLGAGCGSKRAHVTTAGSALISVPTGLNFVSSVEAASAPDFVVEVAGCASGFTAVYTSTTAAPLTTLAAYKNDVGCLAGLKQFTYQGSVYAKEGGGNLTAGNATFVSASKKLYVYNTAQLDSPLSDAAAVRFEFFQDRLNSDNSATLSQSHALGIQGAGAPNFEIQSVALNGALSATGEPTYLLKWVCQAALNAGKCPTADGELQAIAGMDVKVVEDTFAGVLSHSAALGLFATAGTVPTVEATGMSAIVKGPGPLDKKRNLLVVIRYVALGGASFTYFNLDIGTP